MRIDFEGQTHEFPDDFTDAEVAAALKTVGPAAPIDAESQRHLDKNVTYSNVPPTPRDQVEPMSGEREHTKNNRLRVELQKLEERLSQLEPTMTLKQRAQSPEIRQLQESIARLKKALPIDKYSTTGGIIGGIGMGVLAIPQLTPAGVAIASTAGAFGGATLGAFIDAADQDMNDTEREEFMRTKGIEAMVYDGAGNVAIWAGGKVVTTIAKNTMWGKKLIEKFGGIIKPVGHDVKSKVGGVVFDGDTTSAELIRQNERAVRGMSQGPNAPTAGQVSGRPNAAENTGRSIYGDVFKENDEVLGQKVMDNVKAFRARIEGNQSGRFPGETLHMGVNKIEQEVGAQIRPVYAKLSDPQGPFAAGLVDVSAVRNSALEELNKYKAALKRTGKTLEPQELERITELSGMPARISLVEAQELQSRYGTLVRGMTAEGKKNNNLIRILSEYGGKVREALDQGLDDALRSGKLTPEEVASVEQARNLSREMNKTVYSKSIMQAMGEDAEKVAGRIGATGNVTEVEDLQRLRILAGNLDDMSEAQMQAKAAQLGLPAEKGTALKKMLTEAQNGTRGEYFGKHFKTIDDIAKLPELMKDDKFARTMRAMFPSKADQLSIEMIAQAAQIIKRGATEGLTPGIARSVAITMSTGAAAGGAVAGATGAGIGVVATVISAYMGGKALAHAMTKPEIKIMMPRVSAWLVHAARRGAAGAATEYRNAPDFIKDFINQMNADGFTPEAAAAEEPTQAAVEPTQTASDESNLPPLNAREQILASEREFAASPQGQAALRAMPPTERPENVSMRWGTSGADMLVDLQHAMANAKTPEERMQIQAEMRKARNMR